MKIIKDGTKNNRCTCQCCHSIIEYNDSDVSYETTGSVYSHSAKRHYDIVNDCKEPQHY